jgi:hypothetical protein
MVGTSFDVKVKAKLLSAGVPICGNVKPIDIINSIDKNSPHYEEASAMGSKLLLEYTRAGLLTRSPQAPLLRDWVQVEGTVNFTIGCVPILAKLDAVVLDPFTRQLAPFDWKIIGGAAKAGASPKKGYAGMCSSGEWGKGHKLWDEWDTKSPSAGYEGMNIPMELIDDKFATQFTIYGWAVKAGEGGHIAITDFAPFPVHFDSGVFNGVKRTIKICSYRAIVSVEYQEKVYARLRRMWNDLTERGGEELRSRLASKWNLKDIIAAAGKETWF